jgi:acyl-CoA thioesterase FadM
MTPSPIEGEPITLDKAWFDYNGHLTDWAYVRVLSDLNEAVIDRLDLGAQYLARTGHSIYTVDTHIRYLAEVRDAQQLRARTRITDVTGKTLRLVTDLVRDDDVIAASAESTYVHVDHSTGRAAAFDQITAARIAAIAGSD